MSAILDWNEFYTSGRYLESWELGFGSPELVGFLSAQRGGLELSALDVGCGSGQDAILLARCGYRAHGIDKSEAAIEIARQRMAKESVIVDFRVANALQMPFEAATLDLVTDRGCFHHLSDRERDVYAEEVARVLRPGGVLFLRGCRMRMFPFVPVVNDALARHFPAELFELGPLVPLELVTDKRLLPANACAISRR